MTAVAVRTSCPQSTPGALRRPDPVLHKRLPPPLVMLIAGYLMWLTDRGLPGTALDLGPWRWLGVLPVLAALALMVLALHEFRRHATTIDPRSPERSARLIERGIYGLTRNPIYLADSLLLLAWGVYLGNPVAFGWVAVFVWVIGRYQISAEERALVQRFGPAYQRYRDRVRRWV
jgi:protein-S-isoprenylcysteine O-methyltransferase Ste14